MGLILKVPYSYDDDLVILETARILGGFVISNDVYRG